MTSIKEKKLRVFQNILIILRVSTVCETSISMRSQCQILLWVASFKNLKNTGLELYNIHFNLIRTNYSDFIQILSLKANDIK